MNTYLQQLMNKSKYSLRKSKKKAEEEQQEKDNMPRNERLAEVKMFVALAFIVVAALVAFVSLVLFL